MWVSCRPIQTLWLVVLCAAGTSVWAQDAAPPPAEDPPAQTQAEDDTPISGGVAYEPTKSGDRTRDPFKSPFELEREEREAQAQETTPDDEDRLVFNIGELELKGIYLQNGKYWAIFRIGDDYDWFQEGVKFRDGDLINITDGAVVFHHYASDDRTQVREVIKELHRGEE